MTVKCRDIAGMIKKYSLDDYIVVKMDIEGAEYDLVLDFLKKDVLKYIDTVAIELHTHVGKTKLADNVLRKIVTLFGTKLLAWSKK